MRNSLEAPVIDAPFSVIKTELHPPAQPLGELVAQNAQATLKDARRHPRTTLLAGLFLGTSTMALALATSQPGQEIIRTIHDIQYQGFTAALKSRQDRTLAAFDQRCATGERMPILINSEDGDVNVRSRPSTSSPVTRQIGNGLIDSVGEVEHYMVVCTDQEAGFVSTKYTVKP